MNLALVYVNVLFSNWNNRFYNALQQRDLAQFSHELAYFCVLAVVFIVMAVYQTYLGQMLQIRWQRWLTDEPQTLEQLGVAFGVSKERVRQLEERAKKRMRARLEEIVGEPIALTA